MLKAIQETSDFLKKIHPEAEIAVILGTGLNGFAENLEINYKIPYKEIPNFPVSTVAGHAGNLIYAELNKIKLLVMQGRFHFYEGYSMQQLTFPIRVMKALGVKTVILSNASGGVNPNFNKGDIMIIRDHINFFPEHPLRGKNEDVLGPRFPEMSAVYDEKLSDKAIEIAKSLKIPYREGVYLGVQGPSLETPAEYRMYRAMGADCVGMSTVPEAIVCHHSGMKCIGFSVITNVFSENRKTRDSHEEILKVGAMSEQYLMALVGCLIPVIR